VEAMRTLLLKCSAHLCALRDAARNIFVKREAASTKASDRRHRNAESGDSEKREERLGRPADFWD
jgi:hypothetical protein